MKRSTFKFDYYRTKVPQVNFKRVVNVVNAYVDQVDNNIRKSLGLKESKDVSERLHKK